MTSAASSPINLKAVGLRKSFGGVEVLHGVSFDVRGGEVLALLGENGAGKSTAIKIMSGDYSADGGSIEIDGSPASIRQPRDAHDYGIRVIYQEFSDAPDLSVAENLHLGSLPTKGSVVDWAAMRQGAETALERVGVKIDVDAIVGTLGVAQRQVVEITRALICETRLLVLDEPTSALSDRESTRLFEMIRSLRQEGVALVYITHRLDELDEIADRVAVFRDGQVAMEPTPFAELSRSDIIDAMVGDKGQDDANKTPETRVELIPGKPAVTLDSVCIEGLVNNVSMEISTGVVTLLFGRVGCGSVELAQSLFGARTITSGKITMADSGSPNSPRQAIDMGVGFVSADRKKLGMLTGLGVAENLTVASWSRVSDRGILWPSRLKEIFTRWSRELNLAAPGGPTQLVETLSGGNQQKVILGRWFECSADLLILVEPTRGVDVRTRVEIYAQLEKVASDGTAVLVISSDIEEVVRLSGEVHVVVDGTLVQSFAPAEVTAARLIDVAGRTVLSAGSSAGYQIAEREDA